MGAKKADIGGGALPFAPRKPWGALVFELPQEQADEIAGGLAIFALGARLLPAAPGRIRVEVYLDSPERAAAAREFAEALLRRAGFDSAGLAVEVIADAGWLEAYQATLTPFPLGRRFTVHPRGRLEGRDGRSPILLVPGRAFGTGEHPTTRLCAEQLERWVAAGSRWLDLGCGSAILSIVAQRCGAAEVLALDSDPEAVEVAAEVLRANGVEGPVQVRRGSVADAERRRFDGVVCNISAAFLLQQLDPIAQRLAEGGRLVLSGFVAEELDALVRRADDCALRECARAGSGPWAVLVVGTR